MGLPNLLGGFTPERARSLGHSAGCHKARVISGIYVPKAFYCESVVVESLIAWLLVCITISHAISSTAMASRHHCHHIAPLFHID